LKQEAIVISKEGERATVSVLRKEACSHCAGRVVCGTAKTVTTTVKNPVGAEIGDTVTIETPTENVLGYAALVFLAPVILAVALYLIFSGVNKTLSIVMPICGFVLPFVCALILDRKKRDERIPVITEIINVTGESAPCHDGE
jgi:positive regulator of sigma E activity